MNRSVATTDRERRLDHGPPILREILRAPGAEQRDQRHFPFLEYDVETPQQHEAVLFERALRVVAAQVRKDEREETSRREDARGRGGVIANVATHFHARWNRLRMFRLDRGAGRKVRRRAGDEIERRG